MGIAAMILGIISLVACLALLIPLPLSVPQSGIVPILAMGSSVSFVGLILGIVALVKPKPYIRMAVAGVVMCSLGIMVSTESLLIALVGEPPPEDFHPSWSPDGSRIAFISSRDGNYEIYVMDADGSNQQCLTDNPANDWYPSWSPDGSRIVFTSDRDDNRNIEIYVMDTDGSNQQRLSNHPTVDGDPSHSP